MMRTSAIMKPKRRLLSRNEKSLRVMKATAVSPVKHSVVMSTALFSTPGAAPWAGAQKRHEDRHLSRDKGAQRQILRPQGLRPGGGAAGKPRDDEKSCKGQQPALARYRPGDHVVGARLKEDELNPDEQQDSQQEVQVDPRDKGGSSIDLCSGAQRFR